MFFFLDKRTLYKATNQIFYVHVTKSSTCEVKADINKGKKKYTQSSQTEYLFSVINTDLPQLDFANMCMGFVHFVSAG